MAPRRRYSWSIRPNGLCPQTTHPGCISASRHRAVLPSTNSMRLPSRPADVTMASRDCGRNTMRPITRHSSSIRTAIGSKHIAAKRHRPGIGGEVGMRRDIVWEWADRPGLEHLALDIRAEGITADGLGVLQFDSAPLRLRYTVRCEGAWRVQEASLALDRGGEQSTVEIRRDDLDHWT